MPLLGVTVTRAEPVRYARLWVPYGTLATAWRFLREAGERGVEQICFLVGREVASGGAREAQVSACVLPLTLATPTFVALTSHAQTARILELLEARGEIPLATLHTHGGGLAAAEHSETDDHGVALVEADGLFSAIVPAFATGPSEGFPAEAALYERVAGAWVRLAADEARERVLVHGDTIRVVLAPDRAAQAVAG